LFFSLLGEIGCQFTWYSVQVLALLSSASLVQPLIIIYYIIIIIIIICLVK